MQGAAWGAFCVCNTQHTFLCDFRGLQPFRFPSCNAHSPRKWLDVRVMFCRQERLSDYRPVLQCDRDIPKVVRFMPIYKFGPDRIQHLTNTTLGAMK